MYFIYKKIIFLKKEGSARGLKKSENMEEISSTENISDSNNIFDKDPFKNFT